LPQKLLLWQDSEARIAHPNERWNFLTKLKNLGLPEPLERYQILITDYKKGKTNVIKTIGYLCIRLLICCISFHDPNDIIIIIIIID
jgi:hypothetical protein